MFSSVPISATKLKITNPTDNREQQKRTVQQHSQRRPGELRHVVATFTHTPKSGGQQSIPSAPEPGFTISSDLSFCLSKCPDSKQSRALEACWLPVLTFSLQIWGHCSLGSPGSIKITLNQLPQGPIPALSLPGILLGPPNVMEFVISWKRSQTQFNYN